MLNATERPESSRSSTLPFASIFSMVPRSRFAMCWSRAGAVNCTRSPRRERTLRFTIQRHALQPARIVGNLFSRMFLTDTRLSFASIPSTRAYSPALMP